jgi:hypothetical protein
MTTASASRPTDGATIQELPVPDHRRPSRVWVATSGVAALISLVASVVGLADVDGIYGRETAAFVDQAVAQDLVNLLLTAPATLLLAWLAWRGSLRARLVWTGVVTFTVYSYVIYTMSIHVGPLFLAWVAVLGLSLWSLVGGLRSLPPALVAGALAAAPRRVVGWYLIAVGAVFTLLWLADLVPAVVDGRVPQAALDLALPSNPVHVLDLAVFLPAVIAIGRLVLLRRPAGLTLAPAAVVFLVMTGLPIQVTPFVTAARGGDPAWQVVGPVGLLTVVGIFVLVLLLRPLGRSRPTTVAG